MLISFRTMINTTIFWIIVLLGFRGYTRWIDSTPTQRLLQTIGRDEFATLSLPTETTCQTDILYDKLLQLEGMMQATTISCAGGNTSSMNVDTVKKLPILTPSFGLTTTPTIQTQPLQIAVFDSKTDSQLPPSQQANPQSLTMISRSVPLLGSIKDVVSTLQKITLTSEEQAAGYTNIFGTVQFDILNSTLDEGILTLTIGGIDSLSSAQLQILESALEKTLLQFPQITAVNIRY